MLHFCFIEDEMIIILSSKILYLDNNDMHKLHDHLNFHFHLLGIWNCSYIILLIKSQNIQDNMREHHYRHTGC